MAETDGATGAVAAALSEAKAGMPAPAEQLDLLAATQRPSGDRLSWDAGAVAAEVKRTGKAGRPAGAQNLSTRELKAWIVQLLGGTPQERMARWVMLEPEELGKRLGCSVADAFDRQVAILKELSPYLMAKMQPVDETGKAVPFIQLVTGGQVQGANGAVPWARFLELPAEPVDVTPETGP